MIGNKEVQSIVTSNGGVIYQKPGGYNLVLEEKDSYYYNSLKNNLNDFTTHEDESYGTIETTSAGTYLEWSYIKLNDFVFDFTNNEYIIKFKSKPNENVVCFMDFNTSSPYFIPPIEFGDDDIPSGVTADSNGFYEIKIVLTSDHISLYTNDVLTFLDYDVDNTVYSNKYLFFDSNEYSYVIKDLEIISKNVKLNAILTNNNVPVSGEEIYFEGMEYVQRYYEGATAHIGTNWYLTGDAGCSAYIGKLNSSYFWCTKTSTGWTFDKDGTHNNMKTIEGDRLRIEGTMAYTESDSLDLTTVGQYPIDSSWVGEELGDVGNTPNGVDIHFVPVATTDNNGVATYTYPSSWREEVVVNAIWGNLSPRYVRYIDFNEYDFTSVGYLDASTITNFELDNVGDFELSFKFATSNYSLFLFGDKQYIASNNNARYAIGIGGRCTLNSLPVVYGCAGEDCLGIDGRAGSSLICNQYYDYKIVKNGDSVSFYFEGTLLETRNCSWFDDRTGMKFGLISYSSQITAKAKDINFREI